MNDLLIEIGCEDLPARYVQPLASALAQGFVSGLDKRGVAHGEARSFATPRRIAVLIGGVGDKQADQQIERKGPQLAAAFKDGQPTPAALGFAKSCGVELSKLRKENGQLVFRKKQRGRRTLALLPEIFEEALKGMDELVPKRMRWGSGDETFVRPVRWLLALYGARVVPISRFGLKAGRKTYGHRFHAPAAISLAAPADYEAKLREARVWADFAGRRDAIRAGVKAEAAKLGGTARITDDLLDEVTALVEWPAVISGCIEERFLALPPEVIVATVETNQRYFTVFDGLGKLLPRFITVSNIESKDVAQVIAGNERVVRPRLTDALFFWAQDRKQTLESHGARLSEVTFQRALGSIRGKVNRMSGIVKSVELALRISNGLPDLIGTQLHRQEVGVAATALRAVDLCKNDLVTRMVYEFPELQGVIGGYYALASETEAVAKAISEHYQPKQSGALIPSTRAGCIVALADKLDTLAGIFAIGQKPTASKDPFALRRAALGVLRICIEGGLALELKGQLKVALELQPVGKRDDVVLNDLWGFVVERLRGYCLERGATPEQFDAVHASGTTDPLDFERRVQALGAFVGTEAAQSLAAADKRARNILRQAGGANGEFDTRRLEHPAERALAEVLDAAEQALQPLRDQRNYAAMLTQLAALKAPVDAFFDGVMVMADDPAVRANRLALLSRLDTLCREVADLSLLPG